MVEVLDVAKNYGSVQAVDGVSFRAAPGEILGLLGPNGAGKTTIMKILTCYHFPSAGNAWVNGFNVYANPIEVKQNIGYLPEHTPLYGELNVQEYLRFMARARGVEPAHQDERIQWVVDVCGLQAVRYRSIDALSKGYRQRTGLAQAIIHDPAILILDEPTTGLDPNQIVEIRRLIRTLGKEKTVILSTHYLQEVEAVCDRVVILNAGRIAAEGTTAQIASEMKGDDVFTFEVKGALPSSMEDALSSIPRLRQVDSVVSRGSDRAEVQITVGRGDGGGEVVFDWAVANDLKLLSLQQKRYSLEDVFLQLTAAEESANREAASTGDES
jgi:ABC-2 type transport system ATP-binding protein